MKRAGSIWKSMVYPSGRVLVCVPLLSFAALAVSFAYAKIGNALTYVIYGMSAYSLLILMAACPRLLRRLKAVLGKTDRARWPAARRAVERYAHDLAFRGSVGIYRGMAVNFLYVVFRVAAGVRYTSVWFIAMAVYYLALGALRVYLIVCYRHRTPALERRCYRRTAWLLFLLNIPMGGMIALMVRTNASFSYPGTIIYASALYTFYTMALAIVNLVKYRRLGSPILSAAKVLNLVSAMMSILGLQTAMISRFAPANEAFRKGMNTVTGSAVYGVVILIALWMLRHGGKEREVVEQVGK